MAVRTVRKLGDPILRTSAKEVTDFSQVADLLGDMADSMVHYNGVGLAAPQIGISQALVVIKLGEDFPVLELVNPKITSSSGEEIDVEGCLSIPEVYGEVKRCTHVEVRYQDRTGKEKVLRASGYLARALQHELDHLQGVLFIDKAIKFVSEEE